MTDLERTVALAECEAVIERGLQTFVEVGMALLRIRNEGLYDREKQTFEEYCRARWKWGRAYLERQMAAAEVIQQLSPIGDNCSEAVSLPKNEAQARPLARLALMPEAQREAWERAVADSETGTPTAREVDHVVRQIEARESAELAEERRKRIEAERKLQAAVDERSAQRQRRFVVYYRLNEAVKFIAAMHTVDASDAWDGIWNAANGAEFLENARKAARWLAFIDHEHPNAVRAPGLVIQKRKENPHDQRPD